MAIVYLWRMPQWAYNEFLALVEELDNWDPDSDYAMDLKDRIRSLPNFPYQAGEDDLIRYEITTVSSTVH